MFNILLLTIVSFGRELQSCTSGEYVRTGTCYTCPSDCSTCTDESSDGYPCLTCANSPTYINDSGVCTSCPSNCASCTYTSPTLACQSCTSNQYYLDSSLCHACVSPCSQCSSSTQCISCVSTYYFDGSQCQTCAPTCVTCFYDTSIRCQTCLIDQYLNVDVCHPCTSPCNRCTWDSGNSVEVCSQCINNYYVDGSGICQTCLANEYLNGSTCYPCTSPCNQCTWNSGTSSEVCSQCNQYYYLNGTCQTCSSAGCLDCQYDTPSSSVHCSSCSAGKYVDSSHICQNCVSPCLLCNGSSGQFCTSCIDTYYVDNQTCQPCVSPCLNCSSSSVCTSCRDNFYWDGSGCVACLAPCKNCPPSGPGDTCTSCNTGQYLSGTTCLTCSAKCSSCPDGGDGTVCTTCATNRVFDGSNNCICSPGYFQDSTDVNLCNQCSQRCQTCDTSASNCQSCVPSQNTTLSGNSCLCATNYYYNTSTYTCAQCLAPCYNCNDGSVGTSCKDCVSGSNRILSGNSCICPVLGFYTVSGQTICPSCVLPCTDCQDNGNGTQCTACDATKFFTLSGNACVCMSGYFLSDPVTCLPCTAPCQTCTGTATYCTSCTAASKATPDATGKCISCVPGYYLLSGTTCTICQYSCLTCTGGSASNCSSCPASPSQRTFNSGSKTCPCNAGYYDSGSATCSICHYSCATCSAGGSNKCSTCNTNAQLCTTGCVKRIMKTAGSGICDCLDGYYDIANQQDCGICNYTCQKCSGSATTCTGCNLSQFRQISGSTCPCITGYYDSGSAICLQCNTTCLKCSGPLATNCTACSASKQTSGNTCVCNPIGYYGAANVEPCASCHALCYQCNGALITNCTACNDGVTQRFLSQSQCICKDGYYEMSDLVKKTWVVNCGACHFSCLTCTGNSSSSCKTCPDTATTGRVAVGTTCLCTTAGKYIESNAKNCTPCSLSCKTCSGTVGYCTSCNLNGTRRLDQSTTTNTCPCQLGYYDNNNANCFQCSAPCLHCVWNTSQNKQQCTNCDPTKYISGITCVACSASCKTCTLNGNGTQCTSCYDGLYLLNSTCQSCYTRCSTCFYDTAIRCTSCISTYFLNNQDCTLCPTGCSACSLNGTTNNLDCTACYSQFYFDTPVTCAPCLGACGTCPSNNGSFCNTCLVTAYFSSANFCTPCTPPCYTCSGSATSCTSCIPLLNRNYVSATSSCPCLTGYYWQSASSQLCYECQDPCQNCLDFGDGTQCTSCLGGLFRVIDNTINKCVCQDQYYETTYFTCDNCDNSCNKCVTTDTFCLGCFDNSISKRTFNSANNSCPCDPGYFSLYDTAANCTICDYSCVTCTFTAKQCLSCDANVLRTWNSATQSCPCNPGFYDSNSSDPQCYPCSAPCQNCATYINGSRCTSCIPGLFRQLNGFYCNCSPGYYDNLDNGICLPCQPQCQTCSNNSSCDSCFDGSYRQASNCFVCQSPCATCSSLFTCITCVSGYYKDTSGCQQCSFPCTTCPANGPGYSCLSCADTYHMLQGVCQPCDPMCTRCKEEGSASYCTVCNASYNRVLSTTVLGTCVCGPGFYNTGATICPMCNIKCATCVTSATNCQTCAPGYYMTTAPNCFACQLPCATCTSLTQCTTCNSQTFRIMVSNQCKCMDGYYDNLTGSAICQSCQPNSCAKCYFNAGDTSPTCTSCTPNLFRLFVSNNCICQNGYYDSGAPLCTLCPSICTLCTAATSCQACTANLQRVLVVDQCSCIEGYYDTGVDLCAACTAPCFGCSGTDSSCTSCNDPLRIINTDLKQCVCITGYFQNTTDNTCYACDPSCATCADGEVNNSCSSCAAGYYASPTDSTVCIKCSDPCQNCFLADDQVTQLCSSCKTSLRVTINGDGSGSCVCMPNSYRAQPADLFCTQCNSPCYNCQDPGNGTQCLDCVENFFRQYNPTTLTCNCLMTYYYVDPTQQCYPCLSPCFLCQSGPGSDGTQCTQCMPDLNRVLSATQPACPCQDGYFEDPTKVCSLCVDPCVTCSSSSSTCTSCKAGLQRYLNGNVCSCNPGYYDVTGTLVCAQCNSKCQTCTTTSTNCVTCDANIFRVISGSTCICMPTYYDNGTNVQCQQCTAPCFECLSNINGSKCSSCVVGSNRHITASNTCNCDVGFYDPGPSSQCQPCQPTCAACVNNQYCTVCNDPFVLTPAEQGSVCICKSGYTLQNNVCVITCPIDCVTCDASGDCLTCNTDRTLVSGRCTCQFEGGGQYCRQSCDTMSMQELRQTLRASQNTVGTRINSISPIGDQTILSILNSYSSSTSYPNQQIGKLVSNGGLVYFKPGVILDQLPFGQAYYEKFIKDKIVYWVFERDTNPLSFALTYSYITTQNVLSSYNIYKQLPFSDWTQYIQQIQLDSISVVLVFSVRGSQTITLSNSVDTTNLVVTINVQINGAQKQPFIVNQIIFGNTVFTNAQLDSIGLPILQLLDQSASYECVPHPKTTRQIYIESHQYLLSVLPINLIPIQVVNGQNYIQQQYSQNKFGANGGAIIKLNGNNVNYQTLTFQQSVGQYQYATVSLPDGLFFALTMFKTFTFSSFTIQHYISSGYSIQQYSLSQSTYLGTYYGFVVDVYSTASVKTIIFGQQNYGISVQQNSDNIIITVNGAVDQLLFYTFITSDNLVMTQAQYQTIFQNQLQLIINAIQLCNGQQVPIRYVKEQLKSSFSSIIPSNIVPLTENATGFSFVNGTNQSNFMFAFQNSHIISTNLQQNVFYTNGFVKDGQQYFGLNTKYFTYSNQIFILGAQLNGIQTFSISLQTNGSTVACTQFNQITNDGVIYYKAFISSCIWPNSPFLVFGIFLIDQRESTGVTLTQTISTTLATLSLTTLNSVTMLYYTTLIGNKTLGFTQANMQTYINSFAQLINNARVSYPCNFQCQSLDQNYQCATFRSGYNNNQLQEFNSLISDVNNIGGKKCNYFTFSGAQTNIVSKANSLSNFLLALSSSFNDNINLNDGYLLVDFYEIGRTTTNVKTTPPLQNPLQSGLQLSLQTPFYLGAQSQLYSYYQNPIYYSLFETNVDTIYIKNTLNTLSLGQVDQQTFIFNDYGISLQTTCVRFFNNQFYSNIYECFIRQLIANQNIQVSVVPPAYSSQYTINQTGNAFMVYTVMTSTGQVFPYSMVQAIQYKIYSDFLDQTNEQNCVCWGRYRQQSNNCRCQQGYYPPTLSVTSYGLQDCLPCDFRCATCQFTSSQCLSCPSGVQRILNTVTSKCECNPGYYDVNILLCSPCDYTCYQCQTSPSNCIGCSAANKRSLSGSQCVCMTGFYDDGTNQLCQPCHFSCQGCSGPLNTQCTSCSGTNKRQQNGNVCDCQTGFLEINAAACGVCDYTCLGCSGSTTTCTSCPPSSFRTLKTSSCPCDPGYYNIQNQVVCALCSSYCSSCNGPNANQCLSCIGASNRVLSGNNCICGPGFYQNALNSVTCPACNSTCKTCSGTAINCTSCEILNFRTLDTLSATCLCNPGYFDDNVNAACQQCSPSCLTCQFTATQCLSCKPETNRKYDSVNKQCPCLPTFSDVGQSQCLKCDHTCQACLNSASFCTQCNIAGTYRLDMSASTNNCPCMNGYYDDGNNIVCQKCHPSCKQCSQFQVCTSCDITQKRLDQSASGKCPCQTGFYDDNINSVCQTCNYSCATCQTTAGNCLSCTTVGTFRYQSGTQCLCQPGYFDNSVLICEPCYFKCQTCQGTANQCTSCPPSRTGALCSCLIGYIESNVKDCLKCANQCGSCTVSNLTQCTTCNLNRVNPPTCNCLDGYQEMNGVCKPCPLKCETCDSKGQCASCKSDRINFPECVCPSGYYDDGIVAQCQVCYSYCQLCTATLCQSCQGNRIMKDNGCICPTDSQEIAGSPYCNNCQVAAITAQFSDDLSSIIITFPYTVQYNPAKYITLANACSLVFTSATYNLLGQQPLCSIANTNFIITLGSQSSITKDSTFNFNTNIMQKLGCFIQIQIFYVVSFTYPTIIPYPQFILSQFPNPLTLCQDIIIQINNIQGDGNRNFPTVVWSVVSISPQNATTASYLSNLLSTTNKNGLQSLTIQKMSLDQYGTYVIQLKAFNFLNKSYTTQTTFSTSSYEAPILNFASNQDFVFGRWQDIAISVTFSHLECTTGVVKEVFDAMRVNWTQISSTNTSRLLQTVTPLLSSSQITETDGMTFIDTLTIPAYTALIGFDYTFLVQIALTNKPIVASQIFTINIQSTAMQAYIEGGTRTQSFGDAAVIAGFCRDPDVMAEWNADPDITFNWKCINLVNSLPCTDSNSVFLNLNVTSPNQTFGPRVLSPYQPLQFVMENTKNNVSLVTTAIILAIELNLPQITASYPSGYKSRKILLHEELNFTLSTETNPDLLRFYCQILYDYKVVAVFQFNFLQVTFRIWDYFVAVSQNVTQFQIKLAAKDPYNYLPSTVTMNLVLNVPPLGCILSVSPTQGTSIIDQFYISVSGCQDTDLPLSYQYHLYLSADIMNQDTIKGDTLQKKTLTDPQTTAILSTVMPTPYNSDGTQAKSIILIASIYDSEMGVTNLTKSISLQSIQTKVFSGVDFNSILLQISRSLKLNSITTPTVAQLPSLFIASQELSSLYNSLSSYPQKQTQMKPILQQIYSMLSSFQGKLTSKVMVESLLSSLSAIGSTGITFQQSSTSLIDVKQVRLQILTLSKQLTRQVNDLQYAIQQKYQSGGSTSQYEDQIRSLDNILLNCGLVTDALFNAIKGDSFAGYSDNDINILKSSIQGLNKQVAEATLLRSVPNQKPKSFAGQQMGMKAYKSTPAQVTSLLASSSQNPIFTDSDDTNTQTDLNGVTPTLQQEASESDDAAALQYLKEHPELAAQYGFQIDTTTNATTNTTTNATNGTRILQQVFENYEMDKYLNILWNRHNSTYRRLQQLDPNQVKQYSVQMKQYETSPYTNDPAFKASLASNITNNNSNTTQSVVSNFGTVDPQINVSQNGNNSQLTSLNGQKISLQFNPPKGLNSTNLTCSSKGTDQWQTGQCSIKKIVASDGKITYACDCQIINPTTVLTTLDSLISNKLNSVFGADSFSTFLNIQFWNYAIFYIAIAFSGVFIYLMINGQKRDNEDFIQLIYKELSSLDSQMPEVQQIKSEFREALGPIPEEEEKEETLLNAQQIKQQLQGDQLIGQDPEKVKQLAFASLNTAPIVMKKTEGGIQISNKVHPIVKDRHDELVELNKEQVDLGSIQRSLAMHELMGNQKKNILGKATKLREVIKNVYSSNELNYEHGQTIKMKPLSVQLLLQGVITLHRVLCILTIYDEVISRSARFALIYAKTILVLALSALFSGNFGPVYSVLISNLVSQVINIILTIITVLMKANPILKFIGIVFTFIVSTVCWYIVIMLSAQMDQAAADAWAIQFISAQISDLVVIECLTISIKLAIYPWTIKALNAPNGEGNIIAHLLFIVVAQPQISQFFQVE